MYGYMSTRACVWTDEKKVHSLCMACLCRFIHPSITQSPTNTQAGIFETVACIMAYLIVFWTNGVSSKDLINFGTTDTVTLASGLTMDMERQTRVISMAM